MKSDQRWSAMTYNDRATDTWVSWAPGAVTLLHATLLTREPDEDSLLLLRMQITSFTRADIQALYAEADKKLPVPVSFVKSSHSTLFRSWLICSPPSWVSVHLMIMWREAAPIVMLVQTGAASDTQWGLMKLSPAWRATGPVLVVTWIMFWCNVFMSCVMWTWGGGQATNTPCVSGPYFADWYSPMCNWAQPGVSVRTPSLLPARPGQTRPRPSPVSRRTWSPHTRGASWWWPWGPLCVWCHPPGHVICMFEAQGCMFQCSYTGVVTWPAGPVCRSLPAAWCGHSQGSVHSGEPSWESAHSDQEPDNQLSAATTDNSSRECDNNTTTQRQGEARHGVARRLIVDKTVLWSLNSSCNIPQLISRHIAHPTFLILRSLAATVARAGIFKRLRLGLNTHYTHRTERLSYTKQLLSKSINRYILRWKGYLTNIFA